MTARFCPRCHRLIRSIDLPDFIREGRVRIEGSGGFTVPCAHCSKGKIVLRAGDLPQPVDDAPGDLDTLRERETGLPEWVKCISTTADRHGPVYCGRDLGVFGEFTFVDVEHARLSLEQGDRIVPHPACLDAASEPGLAVQARAIWDAPMAMVV